ncbi:ribbon-helix-helix domain-containing protein [Martelella sp. FLE1502]
MIRKHSVSLHGHRTSFSLEDQFYAELTRIADKRDLSLAALIAEIDDARDGEINLSSTIRLFVLAAVKAGT